jgi:hypothetical protein
MQNTNAINKFAMLNATLFAIIENAETDFDVTNEDDMCDASSEYAYVLEQIAQAFAAANFDVKSIVEDAI